MKFILPTPHPLPKTLNSYYEEAQACMTPANKAYFLGGAGGEKTVFDNEDAFSRMRILPRPLRAMGGGTSAVLLLGQELVSPILVAPFAYHRLLDAQGEVSTAQGADAQSVKMILSAQSSVDMSKVRASSKSCDWFQLYWLGSREATLALAQNALNSGFTTIVFTIDAPVQGVRDQEIEAEFQLPADVGPVNLIGLPQPRFEQLEGRQSLIFDRVAHISPDWDDVEWLCSSISAPVLLKGVLHPDDATRAVTIGASGVIVSNHGGRVLDGAPATLDMLPAIIEAVGADYPVLMDGGIRRGADIFVALAMGAKAVLLGRPIACGLAVAGAMGVSHVLRLFRDELEIAMLLSGCREIKDITRDMVHLKR